jgi:hypothetical protein
LYAVQLFPESSGRIATVQLRWQDPETGYVQEINGNFNTWDLEQEFYTSDPYYQLAVVVAQYAEILRGSPWVRASSIDQVLEHAFRIAGLLPENPEVSEFAALVSRASQIRELSRQ